jgi:hypothetical protein
MLAVVGGVGSLLACHWPDQPTFNTRALAQKALMQLSNICNRKVKEQQGKNA